MAEIVSAIVSHPYSDVVILFSILAANGFLIFLWGLSGYVLAHGNEDHEQHSRVQMVNGLALLFAIVALWETIRFLGSLFA